MLCMQPTSQGTLLRTAPTRQPINRTRIKSYSQTKTSWFCGRRHGTTKKSKIVRPKSSKHGEMTTYALLATRCFLSATDATRPEDKRISSHFYKVKAKLRHSPLLTLIQEAHEPIEEESSSSDQAPPFTMNASFFVEDDEGQQDSNEDHYERESEREPVEDPQHSDDERDRYSNDSERVKYDSDRSSESGSQSDSNAPF
jgi:hypothetical protein